MKSLANINLDGAHLLPPLTDGKKLNRFSPNHAWVYSGLAAVEGLLLYIAWTIDWLVHRGPFAAACAMLSAVVFVVFFEAFFTDIYRVIARRLSL